MAAVASKRGIELTSLSRPLRPDDLVRFEYILAMDFSNKAAIEVAADHWANEGLPVPKDYRDKVRIAQLTPTSRYIPTMPLHTPTSVMGESTSHSLNGTIQTTTVPCEA